MQTALYPEIFFKVVVYDKYGESYSQGIYETLEEAIDVAERSMEFTRDRDSGYWEPRKGTEGRVWIEQTIIVDEDALPITREKCLEKWYAEIA